MAVDLTQIGATGLRQFGGHVREEFLPELTGSRGIKVYREMESNDAVVGAVLFALSTLIRRTSWRTEPASSARDDQEAAEFVDQCRGDMSQSWGDMIAEALSFLPYGWSFHELVYKLRKGDSRDPSQRSQYTDGRVAWRKIERRMQTSLQRWVFDDEGGLQGMVQSAAPAYREVTIPIEKGLLFRTGSSGGNPEGRSILRTAYRSWYFLKRMQEIEGTGAERDLAGLPVAHVPVEYLSISENDPKAAEKRAVADEIKRIVTSIRRDEQEGIVWPQAYDANKNPLFKLELLTSGGRRQFDTDKIITRYEQRIAMSVLADFILLGHEKVGSNSLGITKAELFVTAIESFLSIVLDVFNRYAIPRLLQLNGMRGRCLLAHGEVDRVDLRELGAYIQQLSGAQILVRDDVLEGHLREQARLPAPDKATATPRAPSPVPTEKRRPFVDATAATARAAVAKDEGGAAGEVDELTEALLAIADRLSPEIAREVLEAVSRIRSAADVEALVAALEAGDLVAAEASLGLANLPAELEGALGAIRSVLDEAGRAVAADVTRRVGRTMAWDVFDPRVSAWLRTHGAELVQGITDTSQRAIGARLAELIESGRPPREAMPLILEHVGLTERDSAAVERFRTRLAAEEGITEAEVDRRAARYAAQKLRDRAATIADDQALTAAGQARHQAWQQAADQDLVPTGTRRRVVVTEDDRTCPTCSALGEEGVTFGLQEPIVSPHDGTTAMHTPLHVLCRCGEALVWPETGD